MKHHHKILATVAVLLGLNGSAAQADTIYAAQTQIGQNTFEDILTFKTKPTFKEAGKPLQGTVTVPGVFTAKMVGTTVIEPGKVPRLSFKILAVEGGKTFEVQYELYSLYNGYLLHGTLKFPDGTTGLVSAARIQE